MTRQRWKELIAFVSIAVIGIAITGCSDKSTSSESPYPDDIPGMFYSTNVQDSFRIYISLPDNYNPTSQERYPTLYLLDGDWYFDGSHYRLGDGGVIGILKRLKDEGSAPDMILVGIGYEGTEQNSRWRDFLGYFPEFYDFLTEELIPAVDSRYKTSQSAGRYLLGHSDGGFCTIRSFLRNDLQSPPPFKGFVAVSGDYTKNGRVVFSEEYALTQRMEANPKLDISLFMAVGSYEEDRFVFSNNELAATLSSRGYNNFKFQYNLYIGTNHGTVIPPSFRDGLRFVLQDLVK